MKVLVIDDNIDITTLLKKLLESRGYEFTACNDSKEGLELIRSQSYDVILLDLAMPRFSGEDVINALYADGTIKDKKIFLFTASSLPDDKIKEIIDKGAIGCLRKPIEMKKLFETLSKFE